MPLKLLLEFYLFTSPERDASKFSNNHNVLQNLSKAAQEYPTTQWVVGSKLILIYQRYPPGAASHFYMYTGTSKSTTVKIYIPLGDAQLTSISEKTYFLSWAAFQTLHPWLLFCWLGGGEGVIFSLKGTLPLLKQIAPFQLALSITILHTKMVLSLHNEIFCWCPETHLQERVYSEQGFYTKIIMFIFFPPHSCCWLQAQDKTLTEAGSEIETLNITLFT